MNLKQGLHGFWFTISHVVCVICNKRKLSRVLAVWFCVHLSLVCLGDWGASTEVRAREEVTHASQGCDMPGSLERSPQLSREHVLLSLLFWLCCILCGSVSRSDRPFKWKQTGAVLVLANVVGGTRTEWRVGHRQDLTAVWCCDYKSLPSEWMWRRYREREKMC